HSQATASAAAVFSPSHHGCRSTHGRSSKLQAWMDGSRKVSFLPGWSELQIPSGPLEPAISASSSPPPGITSSPSASSAPSDRPQRGEFSSSRTLLICLLHCCHSNGDQPLLATHGHATPLPPNIAMDFALLEPFLSLPDLPWILCC
uniref:Uncharacterized protein n=1 Tax=Aegilops tauschii subsp. strangulata TaxID=200361 RepID=A0A453GP57_AEGTS